MDSSKSGKRKTDYDSGEHNRDDKATELTSVLNKHKAGVSFRRAVIDFDNCRQKGLDYVLFKHKTGEKILFMFGDLSVGGFYIKAEGIDNARDAEVYLQGLTDKNYHVILISKSGKEFSRPMTMSMIIKYWPHHKYENDNNNNRIQFYGNWDDIGCLDPEESFGLESPIWMQLKHLFK